MGDALAVGSLLLFACNAFVVRAASARLAQGLGFLVALLANVAFGVVLVVAQLVLTGPLDPPSRDALIGFAAGGVLSSYLGRRGFFRSVETMGPSRATAVQVTNPLFSAVLAWVLLAEALSAVDGAGLALTVVGLVLTSEVPLLGADGRVSGRRTRLPSRVVAPALFAAVCYALGNVVRGGALDQWDEPVVGGVLGAAAGTVAYVLLHVSRRSVATDLRAADRRGLLLWVAVGTITIAAQIALIAATAHIPVAVAVAISSAVPIIVIPVSVLLFRNVDHVLPRTVVGAGLILSGVVALVLG